MLRLLIGVGLDRVGLALASALALDLDSNWGIQA